MKNTERQKSLDKKKWDKSVEMRVDMSGKMFYCTRCKKRKEDICTISHEQRVAESACAKAYNYFERWAR